MAPRPGRIWALLVALVTAVFAGPVRLQFAKAFRLQVGFARFANRKLLAPLLHRLCRPLLAVDLAGSRSAALETDSPYINPAIPSLQRL